MIEQLSTAVKFLAFYTEEKTGKTGLTVTVDVRGSDGSEIVTAASATEIGDGLYSYTLSGESTGSEGAYVAIFKTATDTVDQMHIPSLWCIGVAGVERLDAAVSSRNATTPPTPAAVADAVWDETISGHGTAGTTGQALGAAGVASDPLLNSVPGSYATGTAGAALGRIGSGQITVTSPVLTSGDVNIVRGDSYLVEDARALTWTGDFSSMDGAVVEACIQRVHYTASIDDTTIVLELSSDETQVMAVNSSQFWIRATLPNESVVTLIEGTFTVGNAC